MTADFVEAREVGPRDGLQGRPVPAEPTARRVELVRRLADAGLSRIEVGSFVSERAVPQMAGTGEVVAASAPLGASIEVLVVNERGVQQAVSSSCDAVLVVVSATDSFSRRNVRSNRAQALDVAESIARTAHEAQLRAVANIAVAFGCPDEGPVSLKVITDTASRLVSAGFEQIFLSDTIGAAGPRDVAATVAAVSGVAPIDAIGLHLHDTRGLGLVNALAGLDAGVRRFDASVGGIGGCPFAPGATGNVATEDLVHLLEMVGATTAVDLDMLITVARWLAEQLGIELPGHVARARRLKV